MNNSQFFVMFFNVEKKQNLRIEKISQHLESKTYLKLVMAILLSFIKIQNLTDQGSSGCLILPLEN